MTPLSPSEKARLLEQMRRVSVPPRRIVRVREWIVLPVGVIVAATLYFALNGPEHGSGRPTWLYAAEALTWVAVAAVSMVGALGHGTQSSWQPRGVLLAVALGAPAVLFAAMCALGAAAEPHMAGAGVDAPRGIKCLELTLAAAVFPLMALLHLRRESDPVHPAFTGAALGSASGASAGVMVEFWCPVATTAHIALGHVLPILVLSALGALLGARALAMPRIGRS
ncbi:MAG TPA: NrsF family protein [Polyangiaceae bacterium]|nr:NrsF family protein [Polyangiaceae bacterium]